MVRVCLVLKEATKLSSKVAVLLCTPTSNEWEVIILKHYFWGIHCKTLSNPRIEKSPFTRHNGSSILFKPMLSPLTHGVRSGALEFPHSEREAAWRARLCDHPWSELRTGVQKYRGSSIIKCIKQSSQPKKAVAEKKNRVWAALWEINSTAFHQVEILALDTHENEPGLIWAPSGQLPDHKSWPNWPASPQRRPLLEQQMVLLVKANMDGQDSRQEDGRTQQAWTRWEPAFKRITFTMHLFKITT